MFHKVLLLSIGLLIIASILTWNRRPSAEKDPELLKLQKEKLVIAEKWLAAESVSLGGHIPDRYGKLLAMKAVRDARLDLATNKEERTSAWENYMKGIEAQLSRIEALYHEHSKGGEEYLFQNTKYLLLEAKCELIKEKAKPE